MGRIVGKKKLTEEQVIYIRTNYKPKKNWGSNAKELAGMFSISVAQIYKVVWGQVHKKVKPKDTELAPSSGGGPKLD